MPRSNRKGAGKSPKPRGNPKWRKGVSGNPSTQWKPGQSGNPDGYSADYRTAKELAREHTAFAIGRLRTIAGKKLNAAAVRACEALLDRAEGKAKQGVEVTGKDGGPVTVKAEGIDPRKLTNEQLLQLDAILAAAAADEGGGPGGDGAEEPPPVRS